LDNVEELTIPEDLLLELSKRTNATGFFLSLSKSVKKMMLQWIVLAKRPETRQKRILEIVDAAENKAKAILNNSYNYIIQRPHFEVRSFCYELFRKSTSS